MGKKILALVMAAVFTAGLFSGCGESKGTAKKNNGQSDLADSEIELSKQEEKSEMEGFYSGQTIRFCHYRSG